MKQSTFFVVGMLAMVLTFGVILAGCDNGTSPGGPSSPSDSGDPSSPTKVATPTASPAGGAVVAGTEIILSTSTGGASIRYTTDGTNPSSATGTEYSVSSKPAITAAATIKAIAYKNGMTISNVLTAAYTIATFSKPPNIIPDPAAAKAYFETIWDDMPPDWQTFFMTVWAEEGADGGGVVPTNLDELDNETWEEMVLGWSQYRNVWPILSAKIGSGASPVAAPPVWPNNGTVIKNYVEDIWNDLTKAWQDYYLETIGYYYNYNHPGSTIALPANLASVPTVAWNYMKTAWNGHRYQPEDAQHIFESLVLAINLLGMSPGDPGLDDFICAGIRE